MDTRVDGNAGPILVDEHTGLIGVDGCTDPIGGLAGHVGGRLLTPHVGVQMSDSM